jgi:FAD/FMN-containing dehydrogenase
MSASYQQSLGGWGNFPIAECEVRKPDSVAQLSALLAKSGTIARGLGRSYGDPALNEARRVIDCSALDRYLAFDEATGTLTCEAGMSLARIIEDFAPRGFFPMITPGTKFVTIGGCIANDVHGKAHHADGCFSRCVESFTILLADGTVARASREENSELFWGNFGGMGLLGIILTATIKLRRVDTTWFKQRAIAVANLDELLDAIHEHDASYPYSVAWVDSLATGKSLGRGVLTVGDHAALSDLPDKLKPDALKVAPPSALSVPFNFPSFSLNGISVRALNMVLDRVQRGGAPFTHYEKFFYPLDAVGEWNRGYGKKGFTQYQFVVPLEGGRENIRTILGRIATSGQNPFLNVLKKFGPEEGILSFPFEGYTFAIDFPIRSGLAEFLHGIDELVRDAGGRIYLGKDAFLEREMFEHMYRGKLDRWRAIKAQYDPNELFTSNLSRRLGLTH